MSPPTGPSLSDVAASIETTPDLSDEVRTALLAVLEAIGASP